MIVDQEINLDDELAEIGYCIKKVWPPKTAEQKQMDEIVRKVLEKHEENNNGLE